MTTLAVRRPSRAGLIQVSAAGMLWGTGGLVVTLLHQRDGLSAMTVSAWRMLLAAVALVAFAAITRRSAAIGATVRDRPLLAIAVGCGTAAYQGLYFVSVLLVGVSVATVVSLGLAPVLAACWEHVRDRSRPSPRQVVVLAGALTGLVLISVTADRGATATGASAYLGLGLSIAAGVTYAVTTVLGHSLAQRTEPVVLTTCTTAVGAVALSPFLLAAAAGGGPVIGTSPGSLALLAYLGFATMAVAYGLLYAGLRTTSGAAATVATLLEPVSAALLAAVVLGERLPWTAWLGGAMILVAVAALRPADGGGTRPGGSAPS